VLPIGSSSGKYISIFLGPWFESMLEFSSDSRFALLPKWFW
jgi:hypothetical protein